MHRRHILPKEDDRRWPQLRDQVQRSYYPHKPIMAYPPYHSNHALPPGPVYPVWGAAGSHAAGGHMWGPPGYSPWPQTESCHWRPYQGVTLVLSSTGGAGIFWRTLNAAAWLVHIFYISDARRSMGLPCDAATWSLFFHSSSEYTSVWIMICFCSFLQKHSLLGKCSMHLGFRVPAWSITAVACPQNCSTSSRYSKILLRLILFDFWRIICIVLDYFQDQIF